MKKRFYLCLAAAVCFGSTVFSQVDSQWRGPARDGVYPGEKLIRQWPASGPKLLWSAEGLGEGFSSPAVTEQNVYVTGLVQGTGTLFALDHTGKISWKVPYGPDWSGSNAGSRTTPTVAGKQIYVVSAMGLLTCFGPGGEKIWSVDLMKEFKARNIEWGITESLLVDGDRVICTPGGPEVMMAALDRHTGKTVWKTKGNGEISAYCSPVIVKHGTRRLLLSMTAKSVVGLDADSGEYLWSAPHITDYDVNPNTPLYSNGWVYTVSGYGTGGQMFQISPDGRSVKQVWTDKNLDSQMGAAILLDGYLYGSGHNRRGWHCLDWKTGKLQFSSSEVGGKGNIIFSDGMLYAYGENGMVALIQPNPAKFTVVGSFRITRGSGPHWAHPVIRSGRLYVRHGEVLQVYDLSR